ncbi:MAG: uridine diphosphate-N-acetylglucosamine-binding protein YvcK [Candidatus Omnitrophica bacterium]|nr:uridine diphosphate-N-acetylglucosamine-binding protein YvcK [Candidatus Omnitrophota bacterium]
MKKVLVVGKEKFGSEIKNILSQLDMLVDVSSGEAGSLNRIEKFDLLIYDGDLHGQEGGNFTVKAVRQVGSKKIPMIMLSAKRDTRAILDAKEAGISDYIIKPYNKRELIAKVNALISQKTRLSCIGGGTGLFNILMGLKLLPNVLLTSIVSTSDSGGSSGRLVASLGILPPGDIRRSLIALSNAPDLMNKVMQYRFAKGDELNGHNFGNLFLAALAEIKGSMSEAVKDLGDLLYIQGIVLPITDSQITLCASFEDGSVVKGESKIDLSEGRDPALRIKELWHEPDTECDINAFSSLIHSDFVVIGPGDLYTSVITNLIFKDIKKALAKTNAKKIYVGNLMTKPGETSGYDAFQHIEEVIRYLGGDFLDYIILSDSRLSDKAIAHYAKKNQLPVKTGDPKRIEAITKAEIILADVSHETELVRHDSQKLKNEIKKIIERGKRNAG